MRARQRLGHTVRNVIAHALFHAGVLNLWQRIALRRRAVVLMYHRVLSSEEQGATASHPALVVHADTFARQMALVSQRFRALSVAEFTDFLERGAPLPDSSCLITFDDGWSDNLSHALPVLDRFRLPSLIFLPVNFIGTKRLFLREALTHLLAEAVSEVRSNPTRRMAFEGLVAPIGLQAVFDATAGDPIPEVVEALGVRPIVPSPALDAVLTGLSRELGRSLETLTGVDGFIGWDDVRSMAQRGVSFGGHGAEHLPLQDLPIDEAEREVRASKVVLDREVGEAIPTFSYPNGSWSPAVAARVKDAGYRLAFTTQPGFVSTGDALFALRRVNIHEDMTQSTPMFLARVLGIF